LSNCSVACPANPLLCEIYANCFAKLAAASFGACQVIAAAWQP
jgi:hypothetical protein